MIRDVFQVTSHERSLEDGFPPLIHRKTKTLHATFATMARLRGLSKGPPFWSGRRGGPCFGFTENVRKFTLARIRTTTYCVLVP
jgi:hypothetical protein